MKSPLSAGYVEAGSLQHGSTCGSPQPIWWFCRCRPSSGVGIFCHCEVPRECQLREDTLCAVDPPRCVPGRGAVPGRQRHSDRLWVGFLPWEHPHLVKQRAFSSHAVLSTCSVTWYLCPKTACLPWPTEERPRSPSW